MRWNLKRSHSYQAPESRLKGNQEKEEVKTLRDEDVLGEQRRDKRQHILHYNVDRLRH